MFEERTSRRARALIIRFGLAPLIDEARRVGTSASLSRENSRAVRTLLASRFHATEGWQRSGSGWVKCRRVERARFCARVEGEFSGREESLILALMNLRKSIVQGRVDVGVLFLAGTARRVSGQAGMSILARAQRCVKNAGLQDLPLVLMSVARVRLVA